ncbi:MAG: carotenoid biosynthesis protein [Spirochaetaceae bacterium]|nr:carotenoid biosynthesis protein [Spirochaetaceae bacterium]
MNTGKSTRRSLAQRLRRDDAFQAGFIAVFFTVGIFGHVFLPVWMVVLTPPVLWAYGLLVAAFAAAGVVMDGLRSRDDGALRVSQKRARLRLITWIVLTYLVTFALEAIGTATGLVFGPYDYGKVLGVMVLAVPVVIGFNWVLVVLGALRIVQRWPWWAAIPTAAVLTTSFDFLMEPAAIHLGYWNWHWDGIPPQNYMAWFVISFTAAVAYRALRIRIPSKLPAYYMLIQAVFFAAIRIITRASI